jgi:hypothetical protein
LTPYDLRLTGFPFQRIYSLPPTQAIVNKLLHGPSVMLKQTEQNGAGSPVVETIRKMFNLD